MRHLFCVVGLVIVAARPAAAQWERYETGKRLKLFEAAWEATPDGTARGRALALVPKATTQFLTLQVGEAGRTLDLARFALASDVGPSDARLWVHALAFVPETRLVDGGARELTVTVRPLYPVKGPPPKDLELSLWFTDAGVVTAKPDRFPFVMKVPLPPLGEAVGLDRRLYAAADGAKDRVVRSVLVSQVKDVRPRLAALTGVTVKRPAVDTLEQATVRDRVDTLTALADGSTFETDLPAASLMANAEVMAAGTTFYNADRAGEFWLSVPLGGNRAVAARVFVPRGLDPSKPVPVVVGLHGAGATENQFFEGYGAGRAVAECRDRGWVFVSVRGGLAFTALPPVVDVLAELGKRYPLDGKRTFLVGHSMGAANAVGLIGKNPGRFAAGAALGGGGRGTDPAAFKDVPFFVGVGSRDFALPLARGLHKSLVDGGAKRATLKEYAGLDHLLVVREALPDAFAVFDAAAK